MGIQAAVAGQPRKNDGGAVLKAGTGSSMSTYPFTNRTTLLNSVAVIPRYGAKLLKAVSPTSSGNIGTFLPITGGTFNYQPGKGQGWLIRGYSSSINGGTITSSALKFGSRVDVYTKNPLSLTTTRRYHITSWNAVTGRATKGVNAGAVSSFGTDHSIGTDAVPGRLAYLQGAITVKQDTYKPRTNP